MQLPIFKRDVTNIIEKRLLEKRHFIQVISGPRQVGKTTAIHQILKAITIPSHYAAADLPAPPPIEWISQQWQIARIKLSKEKECILVLDEVQKITNWSNEIKRLWDEDTRLENNIKVVILGSSALLIHEGLTESLAGRFEIIRFSHWLWKECHDCFGWNIDQYLYFGGYPSTAFLIEDEERWRRYVSDSLIETTISKDILLLNRVEKPVLLRQLFVLACEYGGQILSYQKLLGQLQTAGNTTTLAHYQRLFESAFILYGLGKWSGSALRKRSSSPKWIPLNTSLMTALSNQSFNDWRENPGKWGRLVEVAIGAYLVNESIEYGINVYYWRHQNYEVDFIIEKGGKIIAIEVKSNMKRTSYPGLDFFSKKYNVFKKITIGFSGIDIEEFLKTPILAWFV